MTKYYIQIKNHSDLYHLLESLTTDEGRLSDWECLDASWLFNVSLSLSLSLSTHLNIIHQSDWSLVIITTKKAGKAAVT